MSVEPETQQNADERLAKALERTGAGDPRGPCRLLLRSIKEKDDPTYAAAIDRFESTVRAIADESTEPLEAWIAFARHLAEALDPGTDVVVDATGRSAPLQSDGSWSDLILHIPDDPKRRTSLVNAPPEPSDAQAAAIELLVNGKLRIE